MNIVVLDGAAAIGNDLNFEFLKEFGMVSVYPNTPDDLVVERAKDADILVINKIVMDKQKICACKNLKLITLLATGYNVVNIEAAKQMGVVVCNVPHYSTDSVAQLTFALILHFASAVSAHNASVQRGDWSVCKDFCYSVGNIVELKGKTLGIIGYGAIGRRVAQIASAFGMRVLASGRTPFEGCVSKDEVFEQSDFVSLHCPLNEQSKLMINAQTLAKFKKSAVLINTARGGLIDEPALADALNSGQIAGAGLDVLTIEPPTADNVLIGAKNCVITPHIAWQSKEARERLLQATQNNIRAFLAGEIVNQVNP